MGHKMLSPALILAGPLLVVGVLTQPAPPPLQTVDSIVHRTDRSPAEPWSPSQEESLRCEQLKIGGNELVNRQMVTRHKSGHDTGRTQRGAKDVVVTAGDTESSPCRRALRTKDSPWLSDPAVSSLVGGVAVTISANELYERYIRGRLVVPRSAIVPCE